MIRRTALSFGGACAFIAFGAATAQAGGSDLSDADTGVVDESPAPAEDAVNSVADASAGKSHTSSGGTATSSDTAADQDAAPAPKTANEEPESASEPVSEGSATGKHARGPASEPAQEPGPATQSAPAATDTAPDEHEDPATTEPAAAGEGTASGSSPDEPAEQARSAEAEPEDLLGDLVDGAAATTARPLGSLTEVARQLALREPHAGAASAPAMPHTSDDGEVPDHAAAEPVPAADAPEAPDMPEPPDVPDAPGDDPAASAAREYEASPGDENEQIARTEGVVSSTISLNDLIGPMDHLVATTVEPLLTTAAAAVSDVVETLPAPAMPSAVPGLGPAMTTTLPPGLAQFTGSGGELPPSHGPAGPPGLATDAPPFSPVSEPPEPATASPRPAFPPQRDVRKPVAEVPDPVADEVTEAERDDSEPSPTGNDTAWGLMASDLVDAAFTPAAAGETPAAIPASLTGPAPAGADVSSNDVTPTIAGAVLEGDGHSAVPAMGSASGGQNGGYDRSAGQSADLPAAAVLRVDSRYVHRERDGVAAIPESSCKPDVRPG